MFLASLSGQAIAVDVDIRTKSRHIEFFAPQDDDELPWRMMSVSSPWRTDARGYSHQGGDPRMRRTLALIALLGVMAWMPGCGREMALGGPVSGPAVTGSTFFKAMTHAGYAPRVFDGAPVTSSITALKKAHVNTLAVQLGWYQKTPTSTVIRPDPQKTPTDASLIALIRRAHAAGMYVFLNPFVNALTGDAWQAHFRPTSWDAWFTSYDALVMSRQVV